MKKVGALAFALLVASSFEVAAKTYTVRSYCPMTHVVGIGKATSFERAKDKAIAACMSKGGIRACCYKFVREVRR